MKILKQETEVYTGFGKCLHVMMKLYYGSEQGHNFKKTCGFYWAGNTDYWGEWAKVYEFVFQMCANQLNACSHHVTWVRVPHFTYEEARAERINDLPFCQPENHRSETVSISSEVSKDDFNSKFSLGSHKATEVTFPGLWSHLLGLG